LLYAVSISPTSGRWAVPRAAFSDRVAVHISYLTGSSYAAQSLSFIKIQSVAIMGEAFVNDFPYEPLDTIRLLRLSRGESGHIAGILCHFSMTSPDCPEFTTLSYVWGFPKRYSNFITLNGHRFYVLDSLFVILETICDDPKLVRDWWWIDSISINQAHDPAAIYERSAQVQLMDRFTRTQRGQWGGWAMGRMARQRWIS
jgi:hypothetical protein